MKSFFSCKCDMCYAVYMVTVGISNAKLMSIYTQSSYEKLSHISSTTIATLHCNVYPFFYTITHLHRVKN